MVKSDIRLKNELTLDDKTNIIDDIVRCIIGVDEDGKVFYRPYLKDVAFEMIIFKYMIAGFELEEADDSYTIVTTDKDVNRLLMEFKTEYSTEVSYIYKMVDDIVDFEKQRCIHSNDILNNKLIEILKVQKIIENLQLEIAKKQNKVLSQQIKANEYQEQVMKHMTPEESSEINKKILSGEYDPNKVAEVVIQKYIDSELHKSKEQELIASQQEKIADLHKYKNLVEAKNVLSNKESK